MPQDFRDKSLEQTKLWQKTVQRFLLEHPFFFFIIFF